VKAYLMGLVGFLIFCVTASSEAIPWLPTDDITDNTVWGFSASSDAIGNSSSCRQSSDSSGKKAQEIDYQLSTGSESWVNIQSPLFFCYLNINQLGRAVSFNMAGDGSTNHQLQFYATDLDDHTFISQVLSTQSKTPHRVEISLNSLAAKMPGQILNLNSIKEVGFIITTLDPLNDLHGQIFLDSLNVINPPAATYASVTVDSCTLFGMNDLNDFIGGLNNSLNVPNKYLGRDSRKIPSGDKNQSAGIWERLKEHDVTPFTHLSFMILSDKDLDGDLQVALADSLDLDNKTRQNTLNVRDYAPTLQPGVWQEIVIPVNDFTGPIAVSTTTMGQFTLITPPNSTLYLGGVSFVALTYTTTPDRVLDTLDPKQWIADSGGVILSSAPMGQGNSLTVNEDFTTRPTLQFHRSFGTNIMAPTDNAIAFRYKGTGNSNNLEFKVTSRQGVTVVGRKGSSYTSTYTRGQWINQAINLNDFQFVRGAQDFYPIDFRDIIQVNVAVSASFAYGGNGGSGTLSISNIHSTIAPTWTPTPAVAAGASEGSAMPNPFLPGLGQVASIKYDAATGENFTVDIYNLRGKRVRELKNSLDWDGRNDRGILCEGGVYIFQVHGRNRRLSGQLVLVK
jgi:hypothetical protein